MADLPSGTVTFLFTDIEGSTALWERDQVTMTTAVERHLALLDVAIHAHGGGARLEPHRGGSYNPVVRSRHVPHSAGTPLIRRIKIKVR